jgi:hypothetical protein
MAGAVLMRPIALTPGSEPLLIFVLKLLKLL